MLSSYQIVVVIQWMNQEDELHYIHQYIVPIPVNRPILLIMDNGDYHTKPVQYGQVHRITVQYTPANSTTTLLFDTGLFTNKYIWYLQVKHCRSSGDIPSVL